MTCPKSCDTCPKPVDPSLLQLGPERVLMDVEGYGSITLGFYPNAAPVTVAHILKLFRLGCYDTNHIFRVDRGFVAQMQSVHSASVQTPLSAECKAESDKTVPAEFTNIRHVRGTLSMGRLADPDSGGSSFSMLLGRAAHLDNQCAELRASPCRAYRAQPQPSPTVFGCVLPCAPNLCPNAPKPAPVGAHQSPRAPAPGIPSLARSWRAKTYWQHWRRWRRGRRASS